VQLILHHYDFSSFSEKVRLVLGYKRLDWFAVEIPAIEPKPDYTPLTAGYRRTPALQIGADIYCDTHLICSVLDELAPTPSLYPGAAPAHARACAEALVAWAEQQLFWPCALYITGRHAARFPLAFHLDRARLHGRPAPSVAQVERSAAKYLPQARQRLECLEDLLREDRAFVMGDEPGLVDFALYEAPWFVRRIGGDDEPLLADLPRLHGWMERVAAIGHGTMTPLTASAALAVARASTPRGVPRNDYVAPEGVAIGDRVTVTPFDEIAPATGTLAAIDARRLSVHAQSERAGAVVVHFPRLGYRVSRTRI